MKIVAVFLLLCVAACANTSDTALSVVHADDPVWSLMPDHLNQGEMPQ